MPETSHKLTPSVSPSELAELLGAFNEVTGRLASTHETLRAEVARLSEELTDANAQLERTRRLAALGEMAAGIAHEIRNPLGSIRLYARMLMDDLSDRPEQHVVAQKIARGATHLEGVVGDVLTFSRELRVRPAPIDAGAVFDGVIEACSHDGVPGWRSVTILREGDGLEILADAGLVQQALTNLVRNAIQAMVEAGAEERTLTLSARRGRSRGRDEMILTVRDTGPGIKGEVIARMFNPFFTTRETGTGLGLAIVHRIVDAHGGRITATNNTRSPGASFVIALPMKDVHAERSAVSIPHPSLKTHSAGPRPAEVA